MTESPYLVWLENSEKENQELKYLQYLITKNNVSTGDSYRNMKYSVDPPRLNRGYKNIYSRIALFQLFLLA